MKKLMLMLEKFATLIQTERVIETLEDPLVYPATINVTNNLSVTIFNPKTHEIVRIRD